MSDLLRAPAEIKYAEELEWLESIDDGPKPFSWRLSPKMVRLFILGSSGRTAWTGRSRRSGTATAASSNGPSSRSPPTAACCS